MCAFQDFLLLTQSSGILQPLPPYCCSDDQLLLRKDLVAIQALEGRDFKKVCHNANERQRRRKLNDLYGALRTLLPYGTTNKKKMSVPAVVSRVVKYIPQLQSQIRDLSRDRDSLLAVTKISGFPNQTSIQEPKGAVSFDVRISAVSKMEVVVAVQCPRTGGVLLSHLLLLFEPETFDVLNASSFVSDHMVWHNVHLKVMEGGSLDLSGLRLKIGLLCEKSRGCSAYLNGTSEGFRIS